MTAHRAVARVNVAAIERNCARLRGELSGEAELCAVVKADGYGHGAAQSALAALAGGASWLAVAAASEARELREAGLRDVRVLVMGALSNGELVQALAADADVVVWSERQVQAVRLAGGGKVHVKLDSGMGRLGTRDPAQASRTVAQVEKLLRREPGSTVGKAGLAGRLKLSRFQLYRALKQELGQSPHEWTAQRRIERACLLLKTTRLSIAEIAVESGVPDANYFARFFRLRTGFSPRDWRRLFGGQ